MIVIFSEVYRSWDCYLTGSVKFGESLTRDEMTKFIEKLSQCILPFQCAHGRPTLTPLLTLNNRIEENVCTVGICSNFWFI